MKLTKIVPFILLISLIFVFSSCGEVTGATVETKWNVTFDYNYEEAPDSLVVEVLNNERVTKPDDPIRQGYTFVGWFLDEHCLVEEEFIERSRVSNSPISRINASITFYAGWTETVEVVTLSRITATYSGEVQEGGTLNTSNFTVTAYYSNDTEKAVTGFTVTGFDSTSIGTSTVTVTYTEGIVQESCTVDITIVEMAEEESLIYLDISDITVVEWYLSDGITPYCYIWYVDATDNGTYPGVAMTVNGTLLSAAYDSTKTIAGIIFVRIAPDENEYNKIELKTENDTLEGFSAENNVYVITSGGLDVLNGTWTQHN